MGRPKKQTAEDVDAVLDKLVQDSTNAVQGGHACRNCRGTDHEQLNTLPSTEHSGFNNGLRYTTVTRQRLRCTACGQCSIDMQYVFDPKLWVEG